VAETWTTTSLRCQRTLARELGCYAVVGGLASLVDVGLLVELASGGGVYYLHAAAIAFGCGLLTSYLLRRWIAKRGRGGGL